MFDVVVVEDEKGEEEIQQQTETVAWKRRAEVVLKSGDGDDG